MKKKLLFSFLLNLFFAINLFPQSQTIDYSSVKTDTVINKIPLDHSVYDSWNRLEKAKISNNGDWVSYEVNPQKGDGNLILINISTGFADTISRAYDLSFSPNNDFAAFKIKPQEEITRKAKLDKKKKEDMPKDSIGIITFINPDFVFKKSNLKSFSISQENSSWISFLNENKKDKKDTLLKNNTEVYDLTIFNPVENFVNSFKNVTEFSSSKNGTTVLFSVLKKGKVDTSVLVLFDTKNEETKDLFKVEGYIKSIAIDEKGKQAAFLYTKDTSNIKRYGLYYWNQTLTLPKLLADTSSITIPAGWEVAESFQLYFSQDGTNLYFGTAPKSKSEPKDSLLDEEKFKVDVWNWNDPTLQSEQLKNLEKDKKKTYLAVYNIENNSLSQLADSIIDEIKLNFKGNGNYALGLTYKPYLKLQSWEDAEYKDVYLLNLKTGARTLVAEKIKYGIDISPMGNYLLWYEITDSSWYSYAVSTGEKLSLTKSVTLKFCDELNDLPQSPNPYGFARWTENDEYVLIYDRYDIWKMNPMNKTSPKNLTNGRESKIIYRYVKLEDEINFIKNGNKFLIKAVDENNYSEGFYSADLDNGINSNKLIFLENHFFEPVKSKKSDKIIWQKSSYTEFPDLWISNLDFSNSKKISDANPQMKKYLWGTVEIINWKNTEGEEMKGLLYKPEDFNPSNKYPMLVYFYERYTQAVHTHYLPNPSRSVINYPLYNSNGYLIFIPDITYKIGYPGESALKVVVSGTEYLIGQGFVDKDNVGLQGQSWGGYQVAYIVTRTNMFKAAMAGAPVSNMTSAYGGIRWESGRNRIFQYEQAQSRIGGTLWEKLDLYLENSPIFYADKIATPLLIMSNDNDGAVPWQEGLLFFVSLRRLNKPAWLLSYNGDEHNLTKWPNRKDLTIRMKQYFDYYLKGTPVPVWMEEGIPALEKGKKTGYELK